MNEAGAEHLYSAAVAAREARDWARVVTLCAQLLQTGAAPPETRTLMREARDALRQRRTETPPASVAEPPIPPPAAELSATAEPAPPEPAAPPAAALTPAPAESAAPPAAQPVAGDRGTLAAQPAIPGGRPERTMEARLSDLRPQWVEPRAEGETTQESATRAAAARVQRDPAAPDVSAPPADHLEPAARP